MDVGERIGERIKELLWRYDEEIILCQETDLDTKALITARSQFEEELEKLLEKYNF
jgi:hypothetical protein